MKAFPSQYGNLQGHFINENQQGMDLRDYFAAKAMQKIMTREACKVKTPAQGIARYAYEIADAMIEARKANHDTDKRGE